MKLSLDGLLVLDAIARKGSFAAAAEELHRVPSAITYTVQKLEQDLGVTLFDRSGHRARLTAAGEELLKEGRHLLRAAVDLECRVQRVAKGWETELRVAYDDVISADQLAPLIAEFYEQGSGTRLRFGAEVLGGCWDALLSGRADLAVGAPSDPPLEAGYTVRPMGEIEWVFAVAPVPPAGCPGPSGLGIRYSGLPRGHRGRQLPQPAAAQLRSRARARLTHRLDACRRSSVARSQAWEWASCPRTWRRPPSPTAAWSSSRSKSRRPEPACISPGVRATPARR